MNKPHLRPPTQDLRNKKEVWKGGHEGKKETIWERRISEREKGLGEGTEGGI